VIRSTILTALVFSSIVALADPGLLPEKALASTPQSSKEITSKQSGSMDADATYAQRVEHAHTSCQNVAKERG